MTPDSDSEERFCEESQIAKVRRQISLAGAGENKLAFLLLSGSFNPIHTQHVRALELTRHHLETLKYAVVAAFLAPSSDTQVHEKLGAECFLLAERIGLCRLAVAELDWVSVCIKGEFSSNWACRAVRNELEQGCIDVLNGRQLTGIEVMGSDTVVRIFDKVLLKHSRQQDVSSQRGRTVCCLLRRGPQHAEQQKHIETVLVPRMSELGVELLILDATAADPPLEQVSSSAIRELVSRHEWEVLQAQAWLPPRVLQALRARRREL